MTGEAGGKIRLAGTGGRANRSGSRGLSLDGRYRMRANVGTADRIVRGLLGLALLSLVVIGPQTWWGLLGVVPLATALVSYCPAYALLGVSTRRSN
jgi:hypothetical protein